MARPPPDFDKLRLEEERFLTFHNWPATAQANPEALARAGFFYTGSDDKVQCAFCRDTILRWESSDIPEVEHKKHCPECQFVRGMAVGNVPLTKDPTASSNGIRKENDGHTKNVMLHPMTEESAGRRKSPALRTRTHVRTSLTPVASPKYSEYSEVRRRIDSFKKGKVSPGQTAKALADAGLFYTGPGDKVYCFQCGGNLKDWEPDDDPWEEHKKWYPHCPYIKTQRPTPRTQNQLTPQTSTESHQYRPYSPPPHAHPTPSSSGAYHVDESKIGALMDTPTVRAMRHFGYSRNVVKTTIERKLSTTGNDFPDAESLLIALMEMDKQETQASERNQILLPSASSSQQSENTGKKKRKRKKRTKEKKQSDSGDGICSTETPAAPENDQEHNNLNKGPKAESGLCHSDGDISVVSANQAHSDEDLDCELQASRPVRNTGFDTSDEHWRCCKICMDMPWDLVFTSCGHALCQSCISNWTEGLFPQEPPCPFCRTPITEVIEPKLANMSDVSPQTPREVEDDLYEL